MFCTRATTSLVSNLFVARASLNIKAQGRDINLDKVSSQRRDQCIHRLIEERLQAIRVVVVHEHLRLLPVPVPVRLHAMGSHADALVSKS